ncbi:cytochrome d ubiquinol oxidase subunit II [Tautonia sociabilis]|uniref:Cytochrome d ubiquinol oxidase subunit II n=1 Tax=Tautonia sociabilis TaxID=2080755 RepID=A0A432MG11_9BACT|nr:cytochrome d ubiquinol oxidase subunit II [Tautonia sociabilis]RUL85293.1 cytochrome d ubiquinol oxidase subunit II [Tautonia sociabilis]
MDLHVLWFIILGILLAGYAMLDGFDLGVGMLHLTARDDTERRVLLNAIGPIWDGNEVWLVTFGGAMFAAFPEAYATVFSGFYAAFMLVLFALIFRAVSIEFRSKRQGRRWRQAFDLGFFASSLLATALFGVAVGAAMAGVPLDDRGLYAGDFLDLISPYSVLVGVLAVALFAMHGAIYLLLKTEGDLRDRLYARAWTGFGFFLVAYLTVTIVTLVEIPRATANFERFPWVWLVVFANILAIANIPRNLYRHRPARAFASSCSAIAGFVVLFGIALFPNLVTSSIAPEQRSLTVYNAASSERTLGNMAIVAAIGAPLVLTYTGIVYWTFRGAVRLDPHSY